MKTKVNSMVLRIVLPIVFSIILIIPLMAGNRDQSKRPVGKPTPQVRLPEIQKSRLSNGLEVWLVEHHELPTIALNLVIQSGSARDPFEKSGLASMTADVLDEGTSTRSALDISEELETIGASLFVNASFDGSFLGLNTLSKHVDNALKVYADVLANPTFPQKEFDRLKSQRLTSLIQQKDQPTTIANNVFSSVLYGSNHPYGYNSSGSDSSLQRMTREDLVDFYRTHYRPNNSTLIVVGDTKIDEIKGKLEAALAQWKPAPVPSFSVPKPNGVEKVRVYLVDKPGAPQSEVRIGYPALARSTPDFFPVIVMNRMLGGQFTSRINLNLRERHGYTYGARSSFSFQKGEGPFSASGGIVSEKTDSALREFFYELNLMREQGMTEEELTFVKKGMTGAFLLTFETPSQLAGALQNVVLYNLPETYYSSYLQNIDNVGPDDVRRVANKYLDTQHMAVVVVGDLATIQKGIADLQLGEIIVCDITGKPVQ